MTSYCSNCIHYKVCGNEGVDDTAMTFCADKQTDGDLISRKAVLDMMDKIFFGEDFVEFRVEYGSQGAMYYAMNFAKKLPTYILEREEEE